jgi:hypothetical protein
MFMMIADASCPSKLLATVDNMPSREILGLSWAMLGVGSRRRLC